MNRNAYLSDVSDDGWAFVAPYRPLRAEEGPQCVHRWRDVVNGLRWPVRAGVPWEVVYQQTRRRLRAGVFEAIGHDLHAVLRLADGRPAQLSATISDSHTLPPRHFQGTAPNVGAEAIRELGGVPSRCTAAQGHKHPHKHQGASPSCIWKPAESGLHLSTS